MPRVRCEYCGRVLEKWRPECPSCGALLAPPPPLAEEGEAALPLETSMPPQVRAEVVPQKAVWTKDEVWAVLFQRVQGCIHNLQRCFPWEVWVKRHEELRKAFAIPKPIEPWAIYFASDDFSWAKEGLVFTEEGLFWRNFTQHPSEGFMTWKEMGLLWVPEVIEPCPTNNELICFGRSPLLEIGKAIDALYLAQVLQSIVAILRHWDEIRALLPQDKNP